jgi:hypothetical protein
MGDFLGPLSEEGLLESVAGFLFESVVDHPGILCAPSYILCYPSYENKPFGL